MVTQADINEMNADFDVLLNKILSVVPPHDPRVSSAIVVAQLAKTALLSMLMQFLHVPAQQLGPTPAPRP